MTISKKTILAISVAVQIAIIFSLYLEGNKILLNSLVFISIILIILYRINFIKWTLNIVDMFKFNNICDRYKKEFMMYIFLPTFIAIADLLNGDIFNVHISNIFLLINVSILSVFSMWECVRRIKI